MPGLNYTDVDPYSTADRYTPALTWLGPWYTYPGPYDAPDSYDGGEEIPTIGVAAIGHGFRLAYGHAAPARPTPVRVAWEHGQAAAAFAGTRWGRIDPHARGTALQWLERMPRAYRTVVRWRGMEALERPVVAPWGAPAPHEGGTGLRWGDFADAVTEDVALPASAVRPFAHGTDLVYGHYPQAVAAAVRAVWRQLAARGAVVAVPWGPRGHRNVDVDVGWPVEKPPHPDTLTVPFLPVYAMTPSIEFVRLPDRTPLSVLGGTIQGDLGSFAWSFTAQLPLAELGLVDPAGGSEPVEIEANINGYVFTFLVEGSDDNRRFGSRSLSIRGRSPSALLAGPYAPARTFTEINARTIAQLAEQEIASTGFALSWDAVSWLVPADTFSYQDLTPMDAIAKLASSIGAAVLTDRADRELVVQPTYPISPWAWDDAVPYALIPASVLASADGAWQGGPSPNGVYVYSENAGYGALVKLTGTDGARQSTMIVDPLLGSADPARERGRHELAKGGRIKTETRTIPLFPSPAPPGLIPLGSLLEVADGEGPENTWRGQVMGVRIDFQRSGRAVTVRQVLSLERQFR